MRQGDEISKSPRVTGETADSPEGLERVDAALVVAVLALVGLLDRLGLLLVDVAVVVGMSVALGKLSLALDAVPSLERVPAGLRAGGAVGGGRLVVFVEAGVELDPAKGSDLVSMRSVIRTAGWRRTWS